MIEEMDNSTDTRGEVDSWFMMHSPWPAIILTSAYLLFVFWIGPFLMAEKKAFDLKKTIVSYNLGQIAFSAWWVVKVMQISSSLKRHEWIDAACRPERLSSYVANKYDAMAWYYLMSKFVELLDTIFFVLRNKRNQVTFLHVYHHTNMAVSTWAFVKYVKGSQIIVIGICNTFVHVVMYAYYLLAACGPAVRKYLWCKKYITMLQIIQFVTIICYLVSVMIGPCHVPLAFLAFAIGNTASFLLLFYHYYKRSYVKNKSM